MIEKKIYQEIPGRRNKFHSAVLTSFAFNFHHFEYQVLRTLRQKWISNVMAFVDQRMLDNELGLASGNLKHLSQAYSVTGIPSKGAFHPKINFLIADNELLLFFGSGNITPGGHGKNHELFTGLYADKDNRDQLPLIREAWQYLINILDDIEGYSRDRLLKVIPGTCDMLNGEISSKHEFHQIDDETNIAFLYNDESSIFQQLGILIPSETITQVTIVSPYFDEDGQSLLNLKSNFSNAKIDVFLPAKFGLPPVKMESLDGFSFYDWDGTKRGMKSINSPNEYYRKLHSKIFHFKSDSHEYCLIGSANATIAGLGSGTRMALNEEFCALYRTEKRSLLEELGIKGSKPISLKGLVRHDSSADVDTQTSRLPKEIRINCADLNGSKLRIHFKGDISSYTLGIHNTFGEIIQSENAIDPGSFILTISDEILSLNPTYVVFVNDSGIEVSNKQLINFIDKLFNTDPSKGNRTIRQVLTSLEGGRNNEFEIIEFMNDLNKSKDPTKQRRYSSSRSDRENNNDDDISAAEMTYDEAVEAAKDNQKAEVIVRGHSSTRLWETISRLFQEKHTNIGEDLMDEEEEGSAEQSRDRKEADQDQDKVVIKKIDHFRRMINSTTKLADNYISQLKKICYSSNHEVNELDLGNFLLVTHILTVVCNFKEYEFEESEDPNPHLKELEYLYISKMLEIMEHFTKLLIKLPIVEYQEMDYQKQKFDEFFPKVSYHFWLYIYLIQRRSSHDVVRHKADLVALNFLHYLGEPDNGFNQYLKTLSSSYNDMYFNPLSVERLTDQLLSLYLKPDGQYIGIDHSGICRVLSEYGKEIEYNSLFSRGRINHSKLKKHQIL